MRYQDLEVGPVVGAPKVLRKVPSNTVVFFQSGDRICRRAADSCLLPIHVLTGADGKIEFSFGNERRLSKGDSDWLLIEQVAMQTRSGSLEYFCRDKEGKLHLIHASHVRRVRG